MDVIVSQECICLTTLIAFFVHLALAPENKAEWIGRTQNSSHLRSDYVTHGALDTPLPDTLWHNRTTLHGHLNCVLSAVLRSHIFIFGATLTVTYYDETWTALGWKSIAGALLYLNIIKYCWNFELLCVMLRISDLENILSVWGQLSRGRVRTSSGGHLFNPGVN